jgi:hypothetical protein
MNKPKKSPRFNWDEITHAGDFTLTNGAPSRSPSLTTDVRRPSLGAFESLSEVGYFRLELFDSRSAWLPPALHPAGRSAARGACRGVA